jgi:uncharacterized delta-60 repeat protein
VFFTAVLLVGGAAAMRGQSPLDGFDPNANGAISVVVVQPDGKILVGGDFTTLSPNGGAAVTRNHIARLNPDGTLDTAFDPNATCCVHAIALQPDGKILVGGGFSFIGGKLRNRIARLDPITGQADSWNPDANWPVYTIAVQADGKILAGGNFNGANSIGGQTRNRIARLDPTTGLADSWDPNANERVNSIAVQPDGKILVGGYFNGANSIGGQARSFLARLDPATGLADSWNANSNGGIGTIALQADGKILVGGFLSNIGGQPRSYMARLDPVSALADSFNPSPNDFVNSIAVQTDGKILTGGLFTSIGTKPRSRIARLDPATGVADSFNPNGGGATQFAENIVAAVASAPGPKSPPSPTPTPSPEPPDVFAIAVQPDGKVLAAGGFRSLAPNGGAPVTRNHIARLETDGRLDQTLTVPIDIGSFGFILATAVQADGKILFGGYFTAVNGIPRNNIARLNTDGTLDNVFNPNVTSSLGYVYAIAVQPDGKILVGGAFDVIGDETRNRIARLDPTTGLADSFNPIANNVVVSIAPQADGNILASGTFTSIGGATRNRIARLDPATGAADSFNPNADAYVAAIAVQADSKILAGGNFTTIGGPTRNSIARLDPATGLADSFDPNASCCVSVAAVQADGKILVGGDFNGANSIGSATRNRIARLDATTGVADSFDPNATSPVYSIALQADGKIATGGWFDAIGGQTRDRIARLDPATGLADSFSPNTGSNIYAMAVQADGKILAGGDLRGQPGVYFARFSNDIAALQNLAVTQNLITWTRGGSSPQFARTTFEYSTDSVNYIPLGNGTAAGSNWTLTGPTFPIGQNFYVRARGFYRSGYVNGSESMTESVRIAFLSLPLRVTAVTRSGNDIVIKFDANAGKTYRLERKLALSDANWQSIPGVADLTPANSGPAQFTDPGALSLGKAFYRVRLLP